MDFSITFFQMFFWGLVLGFPILSVLALVISGLGLLVGRLENWKTFDALYWSYITALTVGYGDIRPSRKTTKGIAIVIAWCGIMFTGLLVAIAVKAASEAFEVHMDPAFMLHIEQHIYKG